MKNIRLIVLAALLATFTVISAAAQAPQRPAPAQPAAGTSANAAVPDSKIAFVNTEAFADEKQGITKYINAVKGLEREFGPKQTELANMQKQLQGIADELQKLQTNAQVVSQPTIQQKQEQGEKLQRELKYKQEQYQAEYQSRYQAAVAPISEDIGKALDTFATARGITMVLDVSKLAQSGLLLSANNGMDVTKAFIAEYNSKNPATAAATTPGRE